MDILDERNNTSWPVSDYKIGQTQITATMAGENGYNDLTTGGDGRGQLRDGTISYSIDLPGLKSDSKSYTITFDRL